MVIVGWLSEHHVVALQAQGRAKLGVEAFAEALLGFVKILAENSG